MTRAIYQIRSYTDLCSAFRTRVDEMNVSREALDDFAFLGGGYSGKLRGRAQRKRFGLVSLGAMLEATGTYLILVEDPEALELLKGRLIARDVRNVRHRNGLRAAR